MAISRQLRALGKISGFFAAVFGVVGTVVGVFAAGLSPVTLGLYATMYGALGAMSGAVTALLVARSEAGRSLNEVSVGRMTLAGVLGGASPAALFALVGLGFGGLGAALVPLIGLGALGGVLGGALSGFAAAAAKRGELGVGDQDLLPPE